MAKNVDNTIIGFIRLMLWDGEEKLPIQSLYSINYIDHLFCEYCAEIWHIGRFAVSTDVGRYGLNLFKLLLLYAMYPICNEKRNSICRV